MLRRMLHGATISIGATTAALAVITIWGLGVQEFILAKVRHEQDARQAEVEETRSIIERFGKP